jgi:hypothetical protein
MNIRMKGAIVGEIFELAEITKGLPVPIPIQSSSAENVNYAASVHKTRSSVAGLGIEVVHRPDRRGDDCAQVLILQDQCVFTTQIAKLLEITLMAKIQKGICVKFAVSMHGDLCCLRSRCWLGLAMPGEDHKLREDLF